MSEQPQEQAEPEIKEPDIIEIPAKRLMADGIDVPPSTRTLINMRRHGRVIE